MPKLTAQQVKSASKPGRLSDGDNLYLKISPKGAKSWVFMWMANGKQRELGLGSATGVGRAATITLAKARERAGEIRAMLANGVDPVVERRKTKEAMNFGDAADALLKSLDGSWKNDKHRQQWHMVLREYAKPLRPKSVREITAEDVLACLQPHWQERPETANRLRMRIEKVLDYAKAKGHREGENPARWKGHLDHLLPKPKKLTRGHHEAMPYKEVPDFMTALRSASGLGARALEFTILTAARSGETLGATWSEIDLEAALWTVPAERMKAGKEHQVPLTAPAVALLKALPRIKDNPYLFPGAKKGQALSNMTMAKSLKSLKREETVHGFRSSFRDFAGNETGVAREIAEECLAHVVGNAVENAYRRSQAVDRRRQLLDLWASHVGNSATPADNVVALKQPHATA